MGFCSIGFIEGLGIQGKVYIYTYMYYYTCTSYSFTSCLSHPSMSDVFTDRGLDYLNCQLQILFFFQDLPKLGWKRWDKDFNLPTIFISIYAFITSIWGSYCFTPIHIYINFSYERQFYMPPLPLEPLTILLGWNSIRNPIYPCVPSYTTHF